MFHRSKFVLINSVGNHVEISIAQSKINTQKEEPPPPPLTGLTPPRLVVLSCVQLK